VQKVERNNNYLAKWYENVLKTVLGRFHATQIEPKTSCYFSFTEPPPKLYRMITYINLDYSDNTYMHLIACNHMEGVPIMGCIFFGMFDAFVHNKNTGDTKEERCLFITCETPLKKERQIYRIIDVGGVKQFMVDEDLSMNYYLVPEINRFNRLITPFTELN
jgi:hypothetical protein